MKPSMIDNFSLEIHVSTILGMITDMHTIPLDDNMMLFFPRLRCTIPFSCNFETANRLSFIIPFITYLALSLYGGNAGGGSRFPNKPLFINSRSIIIISDAIQYCFLDAILN